MRSEMLSLAEAKVPRYTSYPTAAQFTSAVGPDHVAGWLRAHAPDAPLSLYVHLPFCRQLCWYCGCNTTVTRRSAPIDRYLATLGREIDLVAGLLREAPPVAHLHFGGGTPSVLEPAALLGLVAQLRARFALLPDAEIALEVDPRGLDDARIEAIAQAGATRISLGIQDLDPDVQTAINRVQPLDLVTAKVDSLRRSGLARIAMDLIYGLPRQTAETISRTARAVAALAPDRVSLFGYAHVPWMKPHQRLLEPSGLPGAAQRLELRDAASEALVTAGYQRIGIDHFALQDDALAQAARLGRLRRNFQGYTTDYAGTLIGFGASAIGSFAEGHAQNAARTDAWSAAIDAGRLATCRGIRTDDSDRRRGGIIERLMCGFEADLAADIAEEPGLADILDGLADLQRGGLVTRTGAQIRIPPEAHPFVRLVAARFDAYLATAGSRHAAAV